ncbi:MAG TPA: peptide deformylase [Thermoanaerobaculia bacterium]|nr:peptide deformylase [Thermoanaerobaculia bacterium]
MAVLPIIKYGDDVLRRATTPVTEFDDALQALIDDMVDTMYAAPGVGLAANQVGIAKRLAVIDLSVGKKPGELHVLINPEIVERIGQQSEDEGCLSIPDFTEGVLRPERVKIRYLDRNRDEREMWGEGLMARALCHETDHLNGNLFIDHLRGFKKERILKKIQKLARAGMWG